MKNFPVLRAGFVLLLLLSDCRKEHPSNPIPFEVSTMDYSNLTSTSVNTGGIVSGGGADYIIARGVCWATHSGPVVFDNKTFDGTGKGSFTSYITGLTPRTLYFIRAYAVRNIKRDRL